MSDRFRQLKDEFDAAHIKGMESLASGDYDTFGEVIRFERDIIEKQAVLLAEHRAVRRPKMTSFPPATRC